MTEKILIAGKNVPTISPEIDYPRPDRLITGNPKRTTYPYYEHPNMACGVWECEVGAWRIAFAKHKQEFFNVLAGRIQIQADSGVTHEYNAGQAGVIPPGFTGIFHVLSPVKKYYVIVEVR